MLVIRKGIYSPTGWYFILGHCKACQVWLHSKGWLCMCEDLVMLLICWEKQLKPGLMGKVGYNGLTGCVPHTSNVGVNPTGMVLRGGAFGEGSKSCDQCLCDWDYCHYEKVSESSHLFCGVKTQNSFLLCPFYYMGLQEEAPSWSREQIFSRHSIC